MKTIYRPYILALCLAAGSLFGCSTANIADPYDGPIIDMHYHAFPGIVNSGYYFATPETKDQKYLEFSQAELSRYDVVLTLAGAGTDALLNLWHNSGDDRIWLGPMFPCYENLDPVMYECQEFPSLEQLEIDIQSGKVKHFGEMLYVYYGISPDSPKLMPYWELAAKYDIPVGVHADSGPPKEKRQKGCCKDFNGSYGSADNLRPILERHPNLRVYLMHFGRPGLTDAAIELMKDYPYVYAEASAVSLYMKRSEWQPEIKKLFDAGLGNRFMFASDYGGRLGIAIEKIDRIPWLTSEQKRMVFYFNAAEFLRLTDDTIKNHWRDFNLGPGSEAGPVSDRQ